MGVCCSGASIPPDSPPSNLSQSPRQREGAFKSYLSAKQLKNVSDSLTFGDEVIKPLKENVISNKNETKLQKKNETKSQKKNEPQQSKEKSLTIKIGLYDPST